MPKTIYEYIKSIGLDPDNVLIDYHNTYKGQSKIEMIEAKNIADELLKEDLKRTNNISTSLDFLISFMRIDAEIKGIDPEIVKSGIRSLVVAALEMENQNK